MLITTLKSASRCMAGGCKNRASIEIATGKTGIRSRLRLCDECAARLYSSLGARFVPKSYETVGRKRGDDGALRGA